MKKVVLVLLSFIIMVTMGCSSKPGMIKGLISWQYNNFIGTKPDVGAQIFVLPESPSTKLSNEKSRNFWIGENLPTGYYYTITNGNGNYEIPNVKPGKYTVIIISKCTSRNFLVGDITVNELVNTILPKHLDDEGVNMFKKLLLVTKKVEIKKTEVKSDMTVDVSNDFGNSYF